MKRNFTLEEAFEYHEQNPTASRYATMHHEFARADWTDIIHIARNEEHCCNGKMKWNEKGTVLLCTECLVNGT